MRQDHLGAIQIVRTQFWGEGGSGQSVRSIQFEIFSRVFLRALGEGGGLKSVLFSVRTI